ncbi:hypothetical protein C0J52_13990 [Blattella germanica]|nr:hypothetical protein C0J52_13990 [Blattella germanica]
MTHATRALQSQDLSGEDRLWITFYIHTFLTTQGHGGPPWISDQLNARATSETTRTYRQRHHSHPYSYLNKANMMKMIMMAR